MIIGTAGHIDHGKTSLIKALTGTNADRLPEEKARGITVDLGFAYQHYDDAPSISFLDVPGHEKLIHNMLAGAIGIDYVLLVVAADDGVMPQTREHLAVIDLIGVARGVIVLTKIDKVSEGRLLEVEAEIAALTAGTVLAGAPQLRCSSVTGEGMAALKAQLALASKATAARASSGNFRVAVDRCFTLTGIGVVVTGTVYSGSVAVGDTLLHSPAGTEVRVRGVRAENRETLSAATGQRCALNLTGRRFEKDQVQRGDWILAPAIHAPTRRLDVRLRLLPHELRALKQGTPVHVHLGASDRTGRVSLLTANALAPGETTFAQLNLEAAVGAVHGDRFVIRDQSALRTIGGGTVLDPKPPLRGTRTPERLATLALIDQPRPDAALKGLLEQSPHGVDLDHFALMRNLTPGDGADLVARLGVITVATTQARIGLSLQMWQALKTEVVAHLTTFQDTHADTPGATIDELARRFKDPRRRLLVRESIKNLIQERSVERFGQLIHLPGHEVRLADVEETAWRHIEDILRASGTDQPRLTLLAQKLDVEPEALLPLLAKLSRIGRIRRVSKAYVMLPETITMFAEHARAAALTHPEQILTVGRFREVTNVTRHLVMPLLEFFDKIGLTRRSKDGRQVRADWTPEPG